ncbi:WD40-repeat-containing domain protein [Suillus fuscotomentosus]|uniref:WD40-repeat-containing domain protein n=1 Tax=Suillus fuscotomentosus TaxID=1912939 RepID=A0AAD4E7S2_9AGAM|nr:WD40-repeat-containing domain protein [Suillus fuscotomentosus]KAG1900871.1 WD40-repeat-containing domain protein [Suillus fuscotomentosus]
MYDFLYDLPHSRFAINALCFSQDACVLASGDDDGYIRLFDFPLGKELRRLRVATAVTSLLWHPNKPDVILIGDARGIVTVMNLHAEVQGFSLRTGVNAPVDTLAYDACNECLAVGVGTDIVLFNHPEDPWTFGSNIPPPPMASMDDNRLLLPLPRALKFSDNGCSLVAVYFQHGIVSWQIKSLQPEWTIWPKSTRVGGACFSADGKTIIVSNFSDGFDCYDIRNGKHLANLPTPIIHNVPLPSLFIEGNMNTVLQVLRHSGTNLEIDDTASTPTDFDAPPRTQHDSGIGKAYCENEAKFIATALSEADSNNYIWIWRTSTSEKHFFLNIRTGPYIGGLNATASQKITGSSQSRPSIGIYVVLIFLAITFVWVGLGRLGVNVVVQVRPRSAASFSCPRLQLTTGPRRGKKNHGSFRILALLRQSSL